MRSFSDVWEVESREHTFLVHGTFNPGEKAITSGPADNWYPGSPECVEIDKVEMVLVRAGHKKPYQKKREIECRPIPTAEEQKAYDKLLSDLEDAVLEGMNQED